MTYLTISKDAQGIISFWASLVEMLLFINFFRYLQLGGKKPMWRCVFLCVLNFTLLQIMYQHIKGIFICPVVLPLWLLLLLIGLITILAVAEQYRLFQWDHSHISATSIKEALDALPMGLCFATKEGLPLLVNETMEELGQKLFEKSLWDAKEAWDNLEQGRAKGQIKSGTEPICELADGRVFGFRRKVLSLEEGTVIAIFATNVTEEYSKTKELAKKQKQASVINTRLKSLLGTIEYVTMSRELLQLKAALHDNLGRSLLSAKRYLLNPESVEPRELLSIWKKNLGHLIGESPEEWQVPYYLTRKEAETLGIDLQIVGTLPEEERLLPLIEQAISTHVINVLRHADGLVAMVHVWETEKEWELHFTNDGNAPEGEIRETGGLGNLKRQVEALGGSMELSAKPRFEMTLVIPKAPADPSEEGAPRAGELYERRTEEIKWLGKQ